jgi:hypothetical protein
MIYLEAFMVSAGLRSANSLYLRQGGAGSALSILVAPGDLKQPGPADVQILDSTFIYAAWK